MRLKDYWRNAKPEACAAQIVQPADCLCLEDRVLYSAAPFDLSNANLDPLEASPLATLNSTEPFDVELDAIGEQASDNFAFTEVILESSYPDQDETFADEVVRNLVFINHDVEQIDLLIADIENLGTEFEVYLLDAQTDGVQQVTAILSRYTNLESLHFVSHGDDGQIRLGNSTLSTASLGQHQAQLAAWNSHLHQDADVLFYGCNLAASTHGQQFVDKFADLTGADVAASADVTGHTLQGGDWELEYVLGPFESDVLFSAGLQSQWTATLATYTVTTTADDGSVGTLRWAIDQANTNGGPDSIVFNIPDSDSGHVYYRDDGIAGSLSLVATTTLDDASILDFDPDYPFGQQHSWFRIDLDNARPQLEISDEIHIDGYSQSGATQNTRGTGHDANLRIELTNSAADSKRGLTFNTGANGSSVEGLAINDFGGIGILVNYDVNDVRIQGNFLGTDITGLSPASNDGAGIQIRANNTIVGGPNVEDRNIISGNDDRGLVLFSFGTISGNSIENNYIGVDATGLSSLSNSQYGIQLYNDDGTRVIDNVISGNGEQGILFRTGSETHNAVIQGNMIGVGADGTTVVGNALEGILVESDSATGNLIGGSGAGEGNIIGNNASHGISFVGAGVSDNFVYGNSIGTDAAGVLNLGNAGSGVLIVGGSLKQTIGGVNPGEANIIAFNNLDGVAVLSGTGTSIRGNSIQSNGDLGIDLVGNNGPNLNDPNDGDGGPNNLQNYPVLTSAVIDGSDITINGTLQSTPLTNNIVVDFYWSLSGDGSGHGEAENYLGSILVNTNAAGNAAFSHTFVGASVPANGIVTATATDPGLNTSEFSQNIETDSIPVITSNGGGVAAAVNVVENTISVAAVTANDDDLPAETLSYTITGGADAALFTLDGSTGQLDFITARDFETFTDANSDGVYEVQVTVDDGNSLTDFQDISVTVTDVNEAPIITSNGGGTTAAINLAENTTAVTDVDATDEDIPANTLAYNITGGADAGLFAIDNSTGQLDFIAPKDFETFEDANLDGVYEVQVTVDDGNGLDDVQDISVTVTDANEAPVITSDGGGAMAAVNVAEGTTAVTDVDASDADVPADTLTYSITGGADSTHFAIDGSTGVLTFVAGKDFETPTDANSDNDYIVVVTVSDGFGGSDSQTMTVSVNDANETPTTSGISDLFVDEDSVDRFFNLHPAFDDPEDADPVITYTIENVTNASLFDAVNITPSDFIQLGFADDQNGVAFITVRATDTGGLYVETTFQVDVNPVNDDPFVATPVLPMVVNEDTVNTVIYLDTVFDDVDILTNSDVLSYSLVSNDNSTLVATLLAGSNFTLDYQPDRFGTATIVVQATDLAGRSVSETISVTVNPINDAPILNDQIFNLDENSPVGTSVGLVVASPGTGDSLGGDAISNYTVVGGTGIAYFAIDSLTGEITVLDASALDFESTPSFTLDVQVTDSEIPGLSDVGTVTVQLNDRNEMPAIVTVPTAISENDTVVGSVSATDQDDFPLTYSISGGDDRTSFAIDPVTGQLSFLFSPDFEAPADFDSDNQYEVIITVTDAGGLTDTQLISIAVIDDIDTPAVVLPTGSVVDPDPEDSDDENEDVVPPPPINAENTFSQPSDARPPSGSLFALQPSAPKLDSLGPSFRIQTTASESSTVFAYVSLNSTGDSDEENQFENSDLNFIEIAGWLYHDLDQLKNEMSSNGKFAGLWSVATPGITTTLSVGYVMWLIKGGQLMAGVMAQVPAWRLIAIDPLPILRSMDEEDLDVEADSLASMVDEANSIDAEPPASRRQENQLGKPNNHQPEKLWDWKL